MEKSRKRNRDLICDIRNTSCEEDGGPGNGRIPAGFPDFVVESGKLTNRPTKRMKGISAEQGIQLKRQSAIVEVAGRVNTCEPEKMQLIESDQNKQLQQDDSRVSKSSPLQNLIVSERSESLRSEKFDVGDIVWARSDRRKHNPAWPAQVIDPVQDAPEFVKCVWVPGRLCVRFFGMKKSWRCAYAWVREEMVFPFLEYLADLAYEGQKLLESGYKPPEGEFSEAIEEAYAAEISSEYRLMQDQDRHKAGETTCSSCSEKFPASKLLEYVKVKQLVNLPENGALICERCCKLYKNKQYCGICLKVCMSSTSNRSWVQCEKCKIWVHADCGNMSSEQLQHLVTYSCPECTPKQPIMRIVHKEKNKKSFSVPERITVVCNGKEADYVTNSHLILCECNECEKGKSMSLSQWERHAGSRMKKWKQSIKLSGSKNYLIDWLNQAYEAGADGLGFFIPEGQTPFSTRERELTGWLLEPYEPIKETWTAERCAVCRRFEDWSHDKIIICNGCKIGVHQDCYGATETSSDDWLCSACQRAAETEIRPERCCLCPVLGGALKPTTTGELWVHAACANFSNQVTYVNDKTMEPVDGILKIDPASFRKSCIICNKTHGSCIKCNQCETYYHTMCALLEGYHMEPLYWRHRGKNVCSNISYCASHKVPDPNVGVRIPEAKTIIKPNLNEVQIIESPIIHSTDSSSDGSSTSMDYNSVEEIGFSEPYAARCRVYNPLKKKCGISAILHQPMGYSQHPREVIEGKFKKQVADPPKFSSYKERLSYCQKNEMKRFRFGKSGVHGYGLFTIDRIPRGDMVIEYRGDLVSTGVANLRENQYQSQGKHSTYFFKIDTETVIDATEKGNLARLINHSCEPNCFSRILAVDGIDNRIALFARKDIEAGEEITYDYKLSKGDIRERCFCGAATCRKRMEAYS